MMLQIIGVQLDQPRQQEIAIAIDRAGQGAPLLRYLGDQAIAEGERAGDDAVACHDRGIGKNRLTHGDQLFSGNGR